LFVNVIVTIDHANAAVAVPDEAVVRTAEGPAVFVAERGAFRRQPVQVGRDDGQHVEILAGLALGTPIAVRNAYVLKSELEKSEVEE
jgi:cobalt-zinc-cadmium efflux system membrane fusion protein